jgi:hypothetical protein
MTKGVLIYAHNNPEVDYGLMAVIAGGLAKKNLSVPVSLVTDEFTAGWLRESGNYDKAEEIFDQIIFVDLPHSKNSRILHDGFYSSKTVPFVNFNRYSAWELSPYENTLLIDSDFLIFSDHLNEYWNLENSLMISKSMNDITGQRGIILDRRVSDTSIDLFWATTVMFKKNSESKFFFELVDFVKDNYRYYSDLFRFNPRQYRNDISFSIAKHIINGFELDRINNLPPVLTVFDKDVMLEIDSDGKITYLLDKPNDPGKFIATTSKGRDVHIMNKQSILRNKDRLLEMI